MPRPQALIVEDTEEFARMGRKVLEQEGFEVTHAVSAEAGLALVPGSSFELYLVDVTLPGMDGFEFCRRLRESSDAYVIMVTGRDADAEKVVGFRMGADDYVTKPYSPLELSARILAMRRRPRAAPQSDGQARSFGRLELDADGREVRVDGQLVELTRIEFDLLAVLSSAPKRVFTRAQLLETVWGYSDGDDHVVNVHMGNMRRKLRAHGDDVDLIRTVRGVGYKFDPAAL
ncbi:response regulator transcription factor [Nocardioides bruguierae]|uniref:response regulator transcription factor n=1 Tax=Nocardioides bruguierae TaxID=2945102 RepID=UPI002021BFEF|nr:response regulator transcription factor [Nocardioides bruguierae]MCL8024751.1 response regulator transcription factor [Nocardioides bruguierae]